jgi:hypothetical protein
VTPWKLLIINDDSFDRADRSGLIRETFTQIFTHDRRIVNSKNRPESGLKIRSGSQINWQTRVVCNTTRKRRGTRDQRAADMLNCVPCIGHVSSEIARGVRVNQAPVLHSPYETQSRRGSTTLSVLFVNSVLHFTKLRASKASPGACTGARDLHGEIRVRERKR